MAKQKPQIVGAVRIGGVVYREGMEDELGKALRENKASEADVTRLIKKGVIAGIDLPDEPVESNTGEQTESKAKDPKDPKEPKQPKGNGGE
jgi:hypothetical protein